MISVLVVDDQPLARRGLRVILDDFPDIQTVGEASSGPEAVALTAELRPDVVLMDVRMPGGDGLTATRELTAADPPIPVVVLTTFDVDEYIFGALDAGASGFLLKSASAEELAAAVRAAAGGDALVAPSLTRRVIREFVRRAPITPIDEDTASRRAHGEGATPAMLTPREHDILSALGRGLNNAQIAAALHLDSGTVRNYLSRIMTKVGVQNRVQLVIWAYRHGLTD